MFFLHAKRVLFLLAIVSLLSGLWGCARTYELRSHQLNAAEVEKLFLDHTVVSRNLNTDTISVSYYGSDGAVTQIRKDRLRTGHWRIKQNGEICMQMESNKESCRFIRLDGDHVYRKYRPTNSGLEPIIAYDAADAFVRGNQLQ